MSHDLHASWASAEVARHYKAHPADCFAAPPPLANLSVYASREGRAVWPIADGVVLVENAQPAASYNVALEFKRKNEGLHGILTALGQSLAYLYKGYRASVIVIPSSYDSFATPGEHLRDVINARYPQAPIGVFKYDDPNPALPSPFQGKLTCVRPIDLAATPAPTAAVAAATARVETQWAHIREGSSEPDAFYRYLQVAKRLSTLGPANIPRPNVTLPVPLIAAVTAISPAANPLEYLSNSNGNGFHDQVWRTFWFEYVVTTAACPIWAGTPPPYQVNTTPTKLLLPDGTPKEFFLGRTDSIKNDLVVQLTQGQITEPDAWKEYAKKVRSRAHSYREDIDSGLEHFGFLSGDGRPTDWGYKFIEACERSGDPNSGTPRSIFMTAMLTAGGLGTLLHYVYRLSEAKFSTDPMAFTTQPVRGQPRVEKRPYLAWLENELANNLHVLRKVTARGGTARTPLQAELTLLRRYGLVGNGYRVGVGIPINWPAVQEALNS